MKFIKGLLLIACYFISYLLLAIFLENLFTWIADFKVKKSIALSILLSFPIIGFVVYVFNYIISFSRTLYPFGNFHKKVFVGISIIYVLAMLISIFGEEYDYTFKTLLRDIIFLIISILIAVVNVNILFSISNKKEIL